MGELDFCQAEKSARLILVTLLTGLQKGLLDDETVHSLTLQAAREAAPWGSVEDAQETITELIWSEIDSLMAQLAVGAS